MCILLPILSQYAAIPLWSSYCFLLISLTASISLAYDYVGCEEEQEKEQEGNGPCENRMMGRNREEKTDIE